MVYIVYILYTLYSFLNVFSLLYSLVLTISLLLLIRGLKVHWASSSSSFSWAVFLI